MSSHNLHISTVFSVTLYLLLQEEVLTSAKDCWGFGHGLRTKAEFRNTLLVRILSINTCINYMQWSVLGFPEM